jgi:uncharacterized protein involved in response to NO
MRDHPPSAGTGDVSRRSELPCIDPRREEAQSRGVRTRLTHVKARRAEPRYRESMHAVPAAAAPRPSPLALCSEEPFRVFFPLGLAAGIAGLSLWPLFLWGWWPSYPALIHTRLMIEGFMGAFIFGFLGTAGPRIIGARHLSTPELAALLALFVGALSAHLGGHVIAGDVLFLASLLTFVTVLGARFATAEELPPPNFVLAGCGLLSAIAGTVLMLASFGHSGRVALYTLGSLLLNEGFVLFPVLGVGAFLFPRLLGNPLDASAMEARRPGPVWKKSARCAGGVAALIVVSFVLESLGFVRGGGALRFATALAYLATQIPGTLRPTRGPVMAHCVRASTWMLLLGLLWPVLLPGYRVAGLHLVFIGGFMLITFTVGTRVILGHSGQGHLFRSRLPFLLIAGGCLLVGLLARIGADFMPSVAGRNAHLIYGALFCIMAALIWGVRLIPRVLVPDPEE